MRITNNMIYATTVQDLNSALGKLTEIQNQANTMKRINQPSDCPTGYYESRELRSTLGKVEVYKENAGIAEGWLGVADSTLTQASSVLSSIKALGEQGATDTYTADNRLEIATQVREYFGELLNLGNADFNTNSIFAGQNLEEQAFVETLYVSVNDDTLSQNNVVSVTGASDTSVLVEFAEDGTVGGGADLAYRYSTDAGKTWTQATLAAGDQTLVLDGCTVTLENGAAVTQTQGTDIGTQLVVRPSAIYQGTSNDGATVAQYGSSPVNATAEGVFGSTVIVRIDGDTNLSSNIEYSYSTDNGATWVEGNTADTPLLSVPGGYVEFSAAGGTDLYDGDQFILTPNTADITIEMSPGGEVVINNVGSEVFGGLVTSGLSNASPAFASETEKNVFETVGKLIGALETNDITGIGDALADLEKAQKQLLSAAADVGGRENRLEFAEYALDETAFHIETRISDVEDVDYSQLMIDLSKYQYIYQSVLSTSSKIMGLSLLNYI